MYTRFMTIQVFSSLMLPCHSAPLLRKETTELNTEVPTLRRHETNARSLAMASATDAPLARRPTQGTALPKDETIVNRAPSGDLESFKNLSLVDQAELLRDYRIHEELHRKGAMSTLVHENVSRTNFVAHKATDETQLLFWAHHKAGTVLAISLMRHMTRALGQQFQGYGWEDPRLPCISSHLGIYQNFDAVLYQKHREGCPKYRAVHIVREASALAVSGYLYHKETNDGIYRGGCEFTTPKNLAGKSLRDGLIMESQAEKCTLKDMVQVRDLASSNQDDVLRLGLEQFHGDFDGTTRKIFTHLLGVGHPKIGELIEMAKELDVNRWSAERRESNGHIAKEDDTNVALAELLGLAKEGNELVKETLNFDSQLGYPNPVA